MAILNNSNAISAGGYDINNSLRFRSSASAYLNRTAGVAPTSNQKGTFSFWIKRGALSTATEQWLFAAGSNSMGCYIPTSDRLSFEYFGGSYLVTTQVFRDPSAWYHIVLSIDSTQATAANRVKLYVNGVQVTSFSTEQYPTQNATFNWMSSGQVCYINQIYTGGRYFDGYETEFNYIDGQQLTPSSFGETDTTTGVWKPKAYTSTYGTNGFYLKFSDIATTSGSNAGLGKDFSGNANYWTTNNISVTSGTTYDAMKDSPTNTSATVANYATWNAVAVGIDATLSSGNLNIAYGTASTRTGTAATIGMSSGKYYWEITTVTQSGVFEPLIGITNSTLNSSTSIGIGIYPGYTANSWGYDAADGTKYTNGTGSAYGATWTSSDTIGVAFDADAGTLTFYKNGTSQGTAFTGLTSGPYFPAIGDGSTAGTFTMTANFGQRPFSYTPPSGYVALNTYNLPTPTILQGNKYMDATTFTGATPTNVIVNQGQFKPDLIWNKIRNSTGDNYLVDSVRGVANYLVSNTTAAEASASQFVTSINSNGFTMGTSGYTSSQTVVGWQWQAGQGSTSSNTQGSITSTVSVNTTAGFSIVTYTGNGTAGATVGHGLGVAPAMIIFKDRDGVTNWCTYHKSLGNATAINLNQTSASFASASFNSTTPTSTLITLNGTGYDVNNSTKKMLAYCWAEIAGFSKFGSYTGNGSADGPFVYTGFRPKFVMIKVTSISNVWLLIDTSRSPYNVANLNLNASDATAENTASTGAWLDFTSNGFKIRNGTDGAINTSSNNYIYAAFAENPFKNSLAR